MHRFILSPYAAQRLRRCKVFAYDLNDVFDVRVHLLVTLSFTSSKGFQGLHGGGRRGYFGQEFRDPDNFGWWFRLRVFGFRAWTGALLQDGSFDDGGARNARDVAVDFHRARFVHGSGDFEDFDAGVHSFSRRVREEELFPRF